MSFRFFNAFDDFFDDHDNVAWSVVPLRLHDQDLSSSSHRLIPNTTDGLTKCKAMEKKCLAKSDRCATSLARMDVVETETDCTVHMELPGISKENVQIHYDDRTNMLTVEAERKEESTEESGKDSSISVADTTTAAPKPFHYYKERYYGHIKRSVTLPQNVDGDNVNASLEHGILKLVFAKKPEKETRQKIRIN